MEKNFNSVQTHVRDKFLSYARPRNIYMVGTPQMSTVIYKGKSSQHMAVAAYAPESAVIKDVTQKSDPIKRYKGFLVNMADKQIHFYREEEVIVRPLPEGAVYEKEQRGKKRQIKNKKLG